MPDDDPQADTVDGPEPKPDPTPASSDQAGKDWKTEAEKWKALARKHEDAAKSLKPLADKAKELEDASKSDLERISAEAQTHQSRAAQAEAELMRLRVAMRKGLTETQAKRLVGSSEDELEEDADDLLASFKPPTPEPKDDEQEAEPERDPNPRRRPQERLRPGAVPDADVEPVETDPRKLAAAIRRDVF
jgi:hypothetical protein